MTAHDIEFIFSLSVLFPTIAAFIAYARVDRTLYNVLPMLLCVCVGLATEVSFHFLAMKGIANYVVNVEIILEFVLMYVQVIYWRIGALRLKDSYVILLGIILWVITTILNHGLEIRNVYFLVLYSFILVLAGIDSMNEFLVSTKNLKKNHQFIFAFAMILFYTYSLIVEAICLNYKIFSDAFITYIFDVKIFINVLTNILFAIALLCVPKKQTFSLSLS